jgi:glycosyltransferase involved in cell wall biosynthesis
MLNQSSGDIYHFPLVSIGIPVYNAESTISACIESVLGQSFRNIELIISDNASNDRTSEICLTFQERDSRIKYFRQVENFGPIENFKFVLEESKGEYFRWLASDDVITANSVSDSLKLLEIDSKFVACASSSTFDYEHSNLRPPIEFDLKGSQWSRLRGFFANPGRSHGLFYSLIKREALIKFPYLSRDFFGWDWCVVLFLLSKGPFASAPETLLILGSNGASSTKSIYQNYQLRGLKRIFPFHNFVVSTIRSGQSWSRSSKLLLFFSLFLFSLKNLLLETRLIRYNLALIKEKFLRTS